MRGKTKEIEKVIQTHSFSIDSIIRDVMKTFNFRSLCHKVGLKKEQGYPVADIITLLLVFPLMFLNSVNAFYKSGYKQVTKMQKDTIYRLKNHARMPWRNLLLHVSKQFQSLVNPDQDVDDKSAFIFDDTMDERVGRRIEEVSYVHDHVAGRKKSKATLGFKNLTMGLFDGKSFNPLDFSLHSEKKLYKKQRKEQYQKKRDPRSNGAKRKKECDVDKITNAIRMLKRAVKHGFKAKYVLVDSWFASKDFIRTCRGVKDGAMHVICAVRKDWRKYRYQGKDMHAKELLKTLKSEGKEKRCRKRNTRYYEVTVYYPGIDETVKLFFCRFPYQKEWRLYLSTDISLSFIETMDIYSVRWTIEVFFRETKQHLRLGKCQSQDFDAQIAHVTTTYILYAFLSYFRRINDYETLGGLFEEMKDDMVEKNMAQRLWEMFDELLDVIIAAISESGAVDIHAFKTSEEYQYIKTLFEDSFLGHQLFDDDNVA
ncbi:transposase [Salicibibacter cibarius]|uniref:Transposase n=1 Tax=Salicibibacter cibarius TaxID=2743000 RepID=A0A7T6Z0Y9_9BACI|nr:transposase [Salicibibacter cibarius]QQK74857.1 transposase [Salicibibacter cibarius]